MSVRTTSSGTPSKDLSSLPTSIGSHVAAPVAPLVKSP